MIIIGYPCIGKSTVSSNHLQCIDLESGSFWIKDGLGKKDRDPKWYIAYAQIAEDLSRQGYIVFVASHRGVRQALRSSKEKVCCIFPSIEMKNLWVDKLTKRYNNTKSEKDYRALKNIELSYEQNIIELKDECSRKYYYNYKMITSNDYNLINIVKRLCLIKNHI